MEVGAIKLSESLFNSHLSFLPLLKSLKKNIAVGNPGMQKLYGQVVQEFEKQNELNKTITNLSILKPYSELIEELLSAVFPPTTANFMYGVSLPFQDENIYASPLFKKLLIQPGTNKINFTGEKTAENLKKENIHLAYGLILNKYMGYKSPETFRTVYPVHDVKSDQTRYMELRVDGRFIDVRPLGKMPLLPESILGPRTNSIMTIAELMQMIPLDQFVFEGISVMRVNDTTESEVISKIKNRLLDTLALSDSAIYAELESYIQSLIGVKDSIIGITPFFKINGHYVYSDIHNANSILFRHFHSVAEKNEISDYCKLLFRENNQPVLYEILEEKNIQHVQSLQAYYKEGMRSVIICPLKQNNELIGLLEVVSKTPGQFNPLHINILESAIPLFVLGLEKSIERLNSQVDSIIKRKYTAVQPAVEWRFTEAALNYIFERQGNAEAKIENISFHEVHPLYGAIDIRNSSIERSRAIQLDIITQLELALNVINKAKAEFSSNLLQEFELKIQKYINDAKDVLQSEEEMMIHEFMRRQVSSFFHDLLNTHPSLKKVIDQYFAALDPTLGFLYHHRKEYENSISIINNTLSRFIDKEQAAAQKVYPHYFERSVTDGLEFNIHLGQSISPSKKFDEIYLRNLKMWQLAVMTKAAKITHQLEKELSHPLRTTQLILVHNQVLSIGFRTEEGKFDVEGAYNTRYEIVKKRIDKVRIKDTNERLTQPGKIAIVYSQTSDAAEYIEYIDFLQSHSVIKPGIEKIDLEELQGVSGLKALRVEVNFDEAPVTEGKTKSTTTTDNRVVQR